MNSHELTDAVSEDFETQWRHGKKPVIGEFLNRVAEEHRPLLLEQLVAVDVEYRRQQNGVVDALDYLQYGDAAVTRARRSIESLNSPLDAPLPASSQIAVGDMDTTRLNAEGKEAFDGKEEEGPDLSFLQPSTKPGSIGRLGHYEILRVLGFGGFGIVFKAFDEKLHRLVAIKSMIPHLAATSPPRKRFLREARAAAAIRHENVVQVYSVEEHPLPYLAMEYIDGETLQQRLKDHGPFDAAVVIEFAVQIANGLSAAHAHGLIHRDIKPGNILIENTIPPKVRITDFGLARTADDASLTQSGVIAGTPLYMSPEQASGKEIDHRSDLFSLGSVIYLMCCGHAPFRAPTTVAVLRRVTDDTPRSLRSILDTIPESLQTIVTKLLEKNPRSRYQTALEVIQDLRNPPAAALAPKTLAETASTTVPVVSTSRRPLIAILLASAVLVVAAVFTTQRWKNFQSQKNSVPGTAAVKEVANTEPVPVTRNTEEAIGWGGWPSDAPVPAVAPFDAAQAKTHQEAWAKYTGLPLEHKNDAGISLVLIPPSEFMMGTSELVRADLATKMKERSSPFLDRLVFECPQHKVQLTTPYLVGKTEITVAQFQQFVEATGYLTTAETDRRGGWGIREGQGQRSVDFNWHSDIGFPQTDVHPVVNVSHDDAVAFCNWLSATDSRFEYRLPWEAEWENAARAGTTTLWACGDNEDDLPRFDWFQKDKTAPVAQLLPNPYGLFDIHGNVIELCNDAFDPSYYFKTPIVNPHNETQSPEQLGYRSTRGGLWQADQLTCRIAHRSRRPHDIGDFGMGFRVVATERTKSAPDSAVAPFDASRAQAAQKAWAEYLNVPVTKELELRGGVKLVMNLVPPGEFNMGSTDTERAAALDAAKMNGDLAGRFVDSVAKEFPQRNVVLTKPFYIGVCEVTQEQFEAVMAVNPSFYGDKGAGAKYVTESRNKLPVENVSLYDATNFCNAVNSQLSMNASYQFEGDLLRRLATNGVRIPTEAEWEFACRAGHVGEFAADSPEEIEQLVWYHKNPRTEGLNIPEAVGTKLPNAFGLYDMHGNISEWTQDETDKSYPSSLGPEVLVNPFGAKQDSIRSTAVFVVKGGDFGRNLWACRSASRIGMFGGDLNSTIGFRVVLGIPDSESAAVSTGSVRSQQSAPQQGTPGSAENSSKATSPHAIGNRLLKISETRLLISDHQAGSSLQITSVDQMPEHEDWHIEGCFIHQAESLTGEDILEISRVPALQRLVLASQSGALPNITDGGISHIFSATGIRESLLEFELSGATPNISAEGYKQIGLATKLSELGLHGPLTVEQFSGLSEASLPDLKYLTVTGDNLPEETILSLLKASMGLRGLQLRGFAGCGRIVGSIKARSTLEVLALQKSNLDDTGLREISQMIQLQDLDVKENYALTDMGFQRLQSLTKLQRLSLANCNYSDNAAIAWSALQNLEWLNLDNTASADGTLSAISGLPKLRLLKLEDCANVKDESLVLLRGLKSVTELQIRKNEQLSAGAVAELAATLPGCRVVSDFSVD